VAELVIVDDDVELCVDSIGEPTDPPLLLVSGFASSMEWWPDELCARLAAGGRFVIRYDRRRGTSSSRRFCGTPPDRSIYLG